LKNWKQEIYKNQKLILYGIITFCLLFANYNLFLKPAIASLRETWPQVRNLYNRLNIAKNAVISIPTYKLQIEDLRKKLTLYNKKFSTKQEISVLLKELSDMAKDSEVKIISIKPHAAVTSTGQDAAGSTYQKFPISINAGCGYHQLGAFLSKLENADTFMRVTDIRITVNPQSPIEHMVYILINTYVLTENA